MRIILSVFLFLILFAGLELYSIGIVAKYLTLPGTIILVVGTGVIGAVIAKKYANYAITRLLSGELKGAHPGKQIFDAMALFLAALLLIIPGLITDLMGIILLLPWSRNIIYKHMQKTQKNAHYNANYADSGPAPQYRKRSSTSEMDDVIDIDAEEM